MGEAQRLLQQHWQWSWAALLAPSPAPCPSRRCSWIGKPSQAVQLLSQHFWRYSCPLLFKPKEKHGFWPGKKLYWKKVNLARTCKLQITCIAALKDPPLKSFEDNSVLFVCFMDTGGCIILQVLTECWMWPEKGGIWEMLLQWRL